jgi:hypothetical protein
MREFVNACVGYSEKENEEWQRARVVSFYSCFHQFKGGKITSPADLFPLPGDKKGKVSKQDNKESIYKALEKWSK